MKLLITYFIITFSLFANPMVAQSSPQSALQKLTLEDALKSLDTKNLELKIASFEEEMNDYAADATSAHHWGSLDLQQNIMHSDDAGNVFGFKLAAREVVQSDFVTTSLNNPDARSFFQTKLTYKVALFAGGKIAAGSDIRTAMKDLSGLDGKALLSKKRYELKKSFYDIELLTNVIHQLTKIKNNLSTLENVTKNMITEGYAKKVDLLEVQSKQASITRLLTQSNANKKLVLAFVSFLVNEKVASIDLDSIKVLKNSTDKVNIENLYMVKKASLGVQISKEMLTVSNADFLPTVGAFAEVSTANNAFADKFEENQGYTVGVQLNWNLFNGLATYSTSQQARVRILKSEQELTLAKKGLALKINTLQTQIASLEAELKSIKAEIAFDQKIVENYHDRYTEKLSAISDVMRAESTHIQKVLEYSKTSNDKNDKILQLQMLTQGI